MLSVETTTAAFKITITAVQDPIVRRTIKEEEKMETSRERRAQEVEEEDIKFIHKEKWARHKLQPTM